MSKKEYRQRIEKLEQDVAALNYAMKQLINDNVNIREALVRVAEELEKKQTKSNIVIPGK